MARPSKVYDTLETDGGWLTVEGIALMADMCTDSVNRMLFRMRKQGRVKSRVRLLNNRDTTEWKAL